MIVEWIEANIKNQINKRLTQSFTKRSISFGVDSAAMAITIISVPKTVANTPPQISGANVRSTASCVSCSIPKRFLSERLYLCKNNGIAYQIK